MGQQKQFGATWGVGQADPARMAAAIPGSASQDALRGQRAVALFEQVLEGAVIEAAEVPRVHGNLLGSP